MFLLGLRWVKVVLLALSRGDFKLFLWSTLAQNPTDRGKTLHISSEYSIEYSIAHCLAVTLGVTQIWDFAEFPLRFYYARPFPRSTAHCCDLVALGADMTVMGSFDRTCSSTSSVLATDPFVNGCLTCLEDTSCSKFTWRQA